MKLRSLLQECTFDEEFKKSPLVYQVQFWLARLHYTLVLAQLVHVNLITPVLNEKVNVYFTIVIFSLVST